MTERETCDDCFGAGVAGHSDSDFTCYKCRGTGGVMTEREELKPCKCGGNPYKHSRSLVDHSVYCIKGCGIWTGWHKTPEDAAQDWNRRAEG